MNQPGVDVVIYINNKPVAGQLNATLSQSLSQVDITNKINGTWSEYLPTIHNWRVSCQGMYVLNAESYTEIENAFRENDEVTVIVSFQGKNYFGQALIIDFPLSSTYNAQFKYSLSLLGTGQLNVQTNN